MEMYIILAITLFMMVMFIWNKVPFAVLPRHRYAHASRR